ncbi:hypothetical protein [Chelativorans sp. AA-79]|uniref:hypothetical protein n=1 Tax=Chelativorans sp. AA-79 TaxID=3028735 RepID=UPI0023F9F3EA|nr:hypothetical protein [Chelativorans sp. AA-79]WEX07398.1 hypothetical protein PVE73_14845 [Chelativorans sp. AA-79]
MAAPDTKDTSSPKEISLSAVEEAQLRAWVDAGYMSPDEYRAEMDRRRSEQRTKRGESR